MTGIDSEPDLDELEALLINNEAFNRIESYLNRFNPIRVMRMERMEIRHSAILAWLLDPRETHGLGDTFLRAFLSEALRGRQDLGRPTALDVSLSDMRDAEVRREWQGIDIFILLPRLNWAFVMENKFYSTQREDQLAGYIRAVRASYEPQGESLLVRGIFLTLLDEEPQDASYAPIRYGTICDLLPRLLARTEGTIDQQVKTFLHHYLEIIREEAGMSDERVTMEALARTLYRKHRKVLDFIIEHGATTDFIVAAEALFGEGAEYHDVLTVGEKKYVYSHHTNYQYSFIPWDWVEKLGGRQTEWPGCDDWWAGYPLICWFQLQEGADASKGQLRLFAEVGPIENHEFRSKLIRAIESVAEKKELRNVVFQRGAADEGRQFSKFLKRNSIAINDMQDAEEIEEGYEDADGQVRALF